MFVKNGDGKILTVIPSDEELTEEQKKKVNEKLKQQQDTVKKQAN